MVLEGLCPACHFAGLTHYNSSSSPALVTAVTRSRRVHAGIEVRQKMPRVEFAVPRGSASRAGRAQLENSIESLLPMLAPANYAARRFVCVDATSLTATHQEN